MLKFGLTTTINETVLCANFGDPSHLIVNWDTKKHKKRWFLASKVIKSLLIPKPLDVQSWNLYAMCILINALCKLSLGAPGHVTKILQTKSEQKVDEFEPMYLGNYRYWWNMVCDFWHTINRLSFGYVHLPKLEYKFSSFFSFFLLFFSFLLLFSGYLLLNR